MAVRELVVGIKARYDALVADGGFLAEWRRLQFDAVSAFVRAQSHFVSLHGDIISALQADKQLYAELRLESLNMTEATVQLRELINDIQRAMATLEHREH